MANANNENVTLDAISKHQAIIQQLDALHDAIEIKIERKEKYISKWQKFMAWLEKAIPKAQGKIEKWEEDQSDLITQMQFHIKEVKQLQATLNK